MQGALDVAGRRRRDARSGLARTPARLRERGRLSDETRRRRRGRMAAGGGRADWHSRHLAQAARGDALLSQWGAMRGGTPPRGPSCLQLS